MTAPYPRVLRLLTPQSLVNVNRVRIIDTGWFASRRRAESSHSANRTAEIRSSLSATARNRMNQRAQRGFQKIQEKRYSTRSLAAFIRSFSPVPKVSGERNLFRRATAPVAPSHLLLSQYCTIFFFFIKFIFNFNKVLAPIYYITMFHSTPRSCKYINTYM